ncbi:hypothetical protein STENM327S_01752 [Streptomyces tendae]
MSPFSATGWRRTVTQSPSQIAGLDHRVADDLQDEQLAVTDQLPGERESVSSTDSSARIGPPAAIRPTSGTYEAAGVPASGPARSSRATGTKAGKGLRVERVHTTPGVHPYDEVAWERRDVVMTNWRDGSVNFEQRGVEFPEFWSVNAVNIVTSKSLPGALSAPRSAR